LDNDWGIKLLFVPDKGRHQILDAGIDDVNQGDFNQPCFQHLIKGLGNQHAGRVTNKGDKPKDNHDTQAGYRQGNQTIQKLNDKKKDVNRDGKRGNKEQPTEKVVDDIFVIQGHGSVGC